MTKFRSDLEPFEPQTGKQAEPGIKYQPRNGDMLLTASVFAGENGPGSGTTLDEAIGERERDDFWCYSWSSFE